MLERATTCLNRGGRTIPTLSQRLQRPPGYLNSAFWSHGAGDIDLPSWWNDFLQQSTPRGFFDSEPQARLPVIVKSNFLDFLYPPQTLEYAQRLAARQRSISVYNNGKKRFYSRSKKNSQEVPGAQRKDKHDSVHILRPPSEEEENEHESPRGTDYTQQFRTFGDKASREAFPETQLPLPEQEHQDNSRRRSSEPDNGALDGQADAELDLAAAYRVVEAEEATKPKWLESSDAKDDATPMVDGPQSLAALHISSEPSDVVDGFDDAILDKLIAEETRTSESRQETAAPSTVRDTSNLRSKAILDSTAVDQNRDRKHEIDYWKQHSPRLGEAFQVYAESLSKLAMLPQYNDDFVSAFAYEVPILLWQLETTYDAGTKFLDTFMDHLYTNILPADSSCWTEKQWSSLVQLTLMYPAPKSESRKRLGLTDRQFPASFTGVCQLLVKAISTQKAQSPVHELLALALRRGRMPLLHDLAVFCIGQGMSQKNIFAFIENIDTPALVKHTHDLIVATEIPAWVIALDQNPTVKQRRRRQFIKTLRILIAAVLQRPLSSDINVASYEQIFSAYMRYCKPHLDKNFHLALDNLLQVELEELPTASAFISLAYKVYKLSTTWSEPQINKLLRGMVASQHPQVWDTFAFYRDNFAYNSNLYKIVLGELSRSAEAERWQEVFKSLQKHEDVDRSGWVHQLLVAYSKRANVAACRAILDNEHGITSTESWNAVLAAYVQADRLSEALEFYDYMIEQRIQRDANTSMILLRAYALRGETALASQKIATMRAEGLQVTSRMMESLIFSYLANDDVASAEQLLLDHVETDFESSKTPAWNMVLTAYAHQGRLADMNYLHGTMQEYGIKEDATTYAALMQGFCTVNMPSQALRLMAKVMPVYNVTPTIHHYNILMDGLVRKRDFELALKMYQLAKRQQLRPDAVSRSLAIKALASKHGTLKLGQKGWANVRRKALAFADELFQQSILAEDNIQHAYSPSPMMGRGNIPIDQAFAAMQFGYLAQLQGTYSSDLEILKNLITRYENFYRTKYPGQQPILAPSMLSAIGNHYLQNDKLDAVSELWEMALKSITPLARKKDADLDKPGWVLPSRAMMLTPIFALRMSELIKREKHQELRQSIRDLTAAGWKFPTHIWNRYVQHLAQTGELYLALRCCEERLISGFPGWPSKVWPGSSPKRAVESPRTSNVRTEVSSPRYKTLVWLAKAYMEFRRRNAFSVQRAELLSELWDVAPKTLNAITNMPRVDDEEQVVIVREEKFKPQERNRPETRSLRQTTKARLSKQQQQKNKRHKEAERDPTNDTVTPEIILREHSTARAAPRRPTVPGPEVDDSSVADISANDINADEITDEDIWDIASHSILTTNSISGSKHSEVAN